MNVEWKGRLWRIGHGSFLRVGILRVNSSAERLEYLAVVAIDLELGIAGLH
jgi:hypothetical protein